MKTIIAMVVMGLILNGCSTAPAIQSGEHYDASMQARVRIYGQNQKPTKMSYNYTCGNKRHEAKTVNLGGGLGDAFSSMIGAVRSKSLGMPETEISRNISEHNGILSRAFFQEFAVDAGKIVSVNTAFLPTIQSEVPGAPINLNPFSCKSSVVSFIPEAGHDYEVIGAKGPRCEVAVFEVKADGGLSALETKTNVCLNSKMQAQ